MGVIPPSVWEKQHKEDEESSIPDSEFLQGDIGVEGNIAPQPDDEKRNNDKNNRKRWFNFFFRRRTRKRWLLSKNNCIGFFYTSGKQRQNLFPVIFRPCSFCRRVSKTKKTEEKWWRLHTLLFQFPNCGKTPCQAFLYVKRGGVVTGPQTVPKVYVGHVFLVPINYISLGMVRATGFLVQLRYVANNSVLCFSDMRFSDTQQARICRKKPESDIYQNYADFVLLRHPCFFCCLRLAISPDVNIFKSPAAPGAFKEKNSWNSKCLLPPVKLATSFVWCMKRICK